jgi:hypothetical protein
VIAPNIGVMVFAFARVSAVAGLKVEDYFPLKNAGGCACGTRAARSMRDGLPSQARSSNFGARISRRPESPTTKKGRCSAPQLAEPENFQPAHVARRCVVHGAATLERRRLETAIGNHSFRAIRITDYLENGMT